MEFDENKTYVLTATRTRATWREPIGNSAALRTKSIRFRRGDKLEGIPVEQVARLFDLGHAVPEDEYDPEDIQRRSAARRLAMTQAAAADARAAVEARRNAANGQPVAGLEDAEPKREIDGIEVEDIDTVSDDQKGDGAPEPDVTAGPYDHEDYGSMDYPQLQNLAKSRTGNGGGSKPELVSRLEQWRSEQSPTD